MGKLSTGATAFMRSVFGRDADARRELSVSTPELAAAVRGSLGYDGLMGMNQTGFGFGDGSEPYGASRQLLGRYAEYEQMDDYGDIACLVGDSKVFTLEYGWKRIKDLAESEESFHVLSYDKDMRSLVPSVCTGARETGAQGHSKQMVIVHMDNGEDITCTSDHLFMMKGEKWVQAGELKVNDRLMPGVIRLRTMADKARPYWQVHQPHGDSQIKAREAKQYGERWMWVHRLVAETMSIKGEGGIVHHLDNDPLNNDPGNLAWETCGSYAVHHIAGLDNSKYFPEWTLERRVELSVRMRGNTHSRGNVLSEETRQRMSRAGKGRKKSAAWRKKIGDANRKTHLTEHQVEVALESEKTIAGVARLLNVSWGTAKRAVDRFDLAVDGGNHRVVNVEFVVDQQPVYDLEVPEYHNFVCNGVVVHNSALDIYCLSGETVIPLLDGSHQTLKELHDSGKKGFEVYSFDSDAKKVTAGTCQRAVKTGVDQKVYRVTFDDGTALKMTATHEVVLLNGKRKYVKDLSPGDSLCALIRLRSKHKGRKNCYENVLVEPLKRVWQSAHRMLLAELGESIPSGHVVHHKDHNGFNNSSINLQVMSKEDHHSEHARVGSDNPRFRSDITVRDLLDALSEGYLSKKEVELKLGCGFRVVDRLCREAGYKSWSQMKASLFGLDRQSRGHGRMKIGEDDVLKQRVEEALLADPSLSFKAVTLKFGLSYRTTWRALRERWGFHGVGAFRESVLGGRNHKVVSVVELADREDVYCLENVEPHHNFAAGERGWGDSDLNDGFVFVGNSDDATQVDSEKGKTVWIDSSDAKIKADLEGMLYKRLGIEDNAWEIVRQICKIGNDFEEILVGEQGVIGFGFLPAATMRRVEGKGRELLGYVQSYSADLSIDPKMFRDLKTDGGGAVNKRKDIAVFEPWRVVHFRLRSKHRDSVYGWSVTDSARWSWRRLLLLEDAVMVYKLCLRGDSEIWTPDGTKKIKDLVEGDEVYSYSKDDQLKKTTVIYKKHNGTDRLFRIKSSHREIYANKTHPVLVETIIGNGSGSRRGRRLDYVEVQNLIPGKHRLVTPSKDDSLCEDVPLIFPDCGKKARLSDIAINDGIRVEVGIKRLQQKCGMQSDLIKRFFAGEYEVVAHTAEKVLTENGTPLSCLEIRDDWGGVKDLNLPLVVTREFAQWFGFMIGDGHVSERSFTRNGKECKVRTVGFAAGDKDEINQKYKKIFESFFGEVNFYRDKRSSHECVGKYEISSKILCEFMILNGFIPGAHNKRIPAWVFRASLSIRQAFLEGLIDADGARQNMSVSEERGRVRHGRAVIELCNRELTCDIRELAMQIGYKTGKVCTRERSGGTEILGNGHPLPARTSYSVGFSYDRQQMTEEIDSVTEVDADDIWDIGVDSAEHNFVADGAVVHNTRSPSRYAFYIDVSGMGRQEAHRELQQIRQGLKKRKFVNPKTGKLDFRFNPMSFDEDFFLGVREGKENARIEVLNGPAYQQVDDVQYFLNKLHAALKVPRAYLGYDENQPSKATLCLAGNTKIPLLDGTAPTIEELSKRDDPFWVYSADKNNNIVPGFAHSARMTRRQAETVEVELDNGEVLTCTPDHPIMMRDGHYEEAGKIQTGDSVMPLYRRQSTGKGRSQKLVDYEQVYHPGSDSWQYTHRMTTDALFEDVPSGHVRHHEDFDRRNNCPENIRVMESQEHLELHRDHAAKTLLRPDVMAKRKAAQAEWLKTDAAKASIAKASAASKLPGSKFWDWVHSDKHRDLKSDQMTDQWQDPNGSMRKSRTAGWRQKMSEVMKGRIAAGTAPPKRCGEKNNKWRADATFEELMEVTAQYRCSSKKEITKWSGYSEYLINRILAQEGITYQEFAEKYMVSNPSRNGGFKSGEVRKGRNHKVVEVRQGPVVDTYDLTVDGHHNFAVSSGIYVHNSQEDVRFARTILRVQREFRNGLRGVCNVHLATRRIDPSSVDFEVAMTVPSSIFELGQMEVRRTRSEIAQSMERHVSLHWLLSEVYRFSDEDIVKIMEQKNEEMKRAQEAGGAVESIVRPDKGIITERDLFSGHSKEDAKRTMEAIMEGKGVSTELLKRVKRTEGLIMDILSNITKVA